jgi:molybdenum-dependent DNA-binding transcriptional regulator ModE
MRNTTRALLPFYSSHDRPVGPGQVEVLESIRDSGSMSEAARGMNMFIISP